MDPFVCATNEETKINVTHSDSFGGCEQLDCFGSGVPSQHHFHTRIRKL